MMKKLVLIALCAMSLNTCAILQDSNSSKNYTRRIATNQKIVPLKVRQVAPSNHYIIPSRTNRSFFRDHPENWVDSNYNWDRQ